MLKIEIDTWTITVHPGVFISIIWTSCWPDLWDPASGNHLRTPFINRTV